MIQMLQKKDRGHIRHAHGHSGMPGIGLLHAIRRQAPNGISHYVESVHHPSFVVELKSLLRLNRAKGICEIKTVIVAKQGLLSSL
jgi:hypothetical protein